MLCCSTASERAVCTAFSFCTFSDTTPTLKLVFTSISEVLKIAFSELANSLFCVLRLAAVALKRSLVVANVSAYAVCTAFSFCTFSDTIATLKLVFSTCSEVLKISLSKLANSLFCTLRLEIVLFCILRTHLAIVSLCAITLVVTLSL